MSTARDPDPQCPYAQLKQMRETSPVTELAPGTFAVTRYDDVKAVLMDPATFSARVGENNAFAVFAPSPVQDQIDEIMRVYPENPVLMRTDPPAHTRVRDLVNHTLTPGEVKKLEPRIEWVVDELMAPWIGRGEVEFVHEFAELLPSTVTTEFLGAPPSMRSQFRFWAAETMSRFEGVQAPERQLEVARNIAAMGQYFLDQIAARRARPTSDFVSMLANVEINGDRLEDVAIVNVIQTVLIGGHETTTFTLGNSLNYLAQHPKMAATLRADASKISAFVEEMLRLDAPAQSVQRMTTREAEIGGRKVPAGATLFVFLASANRDEGTFEGAETMDMERGKSRSKHVAFGYGVHACLGLHLARAELRIALTKLLMRMHAIELVPGDAIERMNNWALRGPTRLNLRFKPG